MSNGDGLSPDYVGQASLCLRSRTVAAEPPRSSFALRTTGHHGVPRRLIFQRIA